MKKVSIIGLGYVGLPTFAVLSNVKKNQSYIYEVSGIEKNNQKGNYIKDCFENKKPWINSSDKTFSKYLKNAFNRSDVFITTDFKKLNQSDIIIVSVNVLVFCGAKVSPKPWAYVGIIYIDLIIRKERRNVYLTYGI